MLFSSYEFVLFFLPTVLVGFFATGRLWGHQTANIWLVAASLFFYGWFNPAYLWIILLSMAVNFMCLHGMASCRRSHPLRTVIYAFGVLFNIGLIGYYKYCDFFITNCNALLKTELPLLHLLLPLGISFFTFQQISYLVDVFRGACVEKPQLIDYMLFVTFFPQLVAGPIVHHHEMMPQFGKAETFRPDWTHIAAGLHLFSIGLFKKLVLADQVAIWATRGFDQLQELTFFQAWFVALSYAMQIYLDFSGYCDMAIGLARLFNIRLPVNFNSPYQAVNIRDFWHRWHITLGRFMSHYVYQPLGGSKGGLTHTCLTLMATFLVSGLWHGAGWTFVLWGGIHGGAMIVQRVWSAGPFKMPRPLAQTLTFLFVVLAWVVFRARDLPSALKVWRGLFSPADLRFGSISVIVTPGFSVGEATVFLAALIVLCLMFKNAVQRHHTFRPNRLNLYETVILFVFSVLSMARISPFIYFNF